MRATRSSQMFLTGNSNTIASIDLEAGSYDIEFIGFERGGGAYFEVFGIGAGGPSPVLLAKDGAGAGVLEPSVALVAPLRFASLCGVLT